jgi:hypothetical protein
MPTDNQARRAMMGAMEHEAKKWKIVVAELEQRIKELETELEKAGKE